MIFFWIVEIGELAGMKKADIEKVKAFLPTSDDNRPSYGRVVESHPRQAVIIATVNGERGYLRDVTGNRRFWIVKCRQKTAERRFSFTDKERDQIWAEAIHIWKSGEKLYLEGELAAESEKAQRSAMEADDRLGMVEQYLDTLLPETWKDMDLYERRNYLSDRKDPTLPKGTVRREQVCNAEIWAECLGRNPADTVIKIMEQEQELNAEIDRLVDLKREIMDVLDEVKDMNYRLILEKRYLCFESWPKIGEDMGHSDRWAQLKHQAALRVVQQILDKRAA